MILCIVLVLDYELAVVHKDAHQARTWELLEVSVLSDCELKEGYAVKSVVSDGCHEILV